MKALNGYIVLRPKEEDSVTSSGLIIQSTIDGELLFVIDSYSVFVNMTAE